MDIEQQTQSDDQFEWAVSAKGWSQTPQSDML